MNPATARPQPLQEYQIMMAIDDSLSMGKYHSKQLALEALSVISKSLTTLEAGELALMSFGEEARLLHPFGQPFTEQSGTFYSPLSSSFLLPSPSPLRFSLK
jgi:midasin (ATPase involved in ribosome maturation)